MNRRNAIKAAIGGIAAACGVKAAKATTVPISLSDHNASTLTVINSAGEVMTVEMGDVRYIDPARFYQVLFEKGRIDIDDIRRMELL